MVDLGIIEVSNRVGEQLGLQRGIYGRLIVEGLLRLPTLVFVDGECTD